MSKDVEYRWVATCGAHGQWQETLTGIDAGLLQHVRRCAGPDGDGCDDAGMEKRVVWNHCKHDVSKCNGYHGD